MHVLLDNKLIISYQLMNNLSMGIIQSRSNTWLNWFDNSKTYLIVSEIKKHFSGLNFRYFT